MIVPLQRFLRELERRNVVRAGIAYLAGCWWLLVQLLETLFPIFGIPESRVRCFRHRGALAPADAVIVGNTAVQLAAIPLWVTLPARDLP